MKSTVIVLTTIIAVGLGVLLFWPAYAPSPQIPQSVPPPPPPIVGEPVVTDSPKLGEIVSSPLTVSGKAKGTWYFEASFPLVIKDAAGKVIGQSHAEALDDWMTTEYVPFLGTIEFKKQPSGTKGFLVLQKDNPSGLPEHEDSREIPIVFK